MKKTALEFNQDLKSFYTTLKETIVLYIMSAAFLIGATLFPFGIIEVIYLCLSMLCTAVWTVYFGFTIMKLFFLSENYEGTGMGYFGDILIQTFIKDIEFIAKKIKK